MNPQTRSEAERILTVIDDLLEELDLVSMLPPFYSNFSKKELQTMNSRCLQALAAHYELERQVELSGGEGASGVSPSISGLLSELRFAGYGKTQHATCENVNRFKKVIVVLRGLMNNNFSTTVEEDDQKLQILRDTVSREQHASADVKALNREFLTERKLRQTEVYKKDQAIHKLMEELDEVQRKAQEDIADYDRTAAEKQLLEEQQAAQEEADLEANVASLEQQLARVRDGNQKDEFLLRAERKKKENNLSTIIGDYDREMTQKAAEKDKLQREYEDDSVQLSKAEEEVKTYDEENTRWTEEDQIKRERMKHKAVIKSRQEVSTKVIQAMWRGFAERSNLKKRGKKGKGGKSGKKK